MNIRKCFSVGLLVAGLTVPTASQAQFFWDFSTTTGADTIAGKLTTDGTFNDTLGTGTHTFTVTGGTDINLNSVDQLGNFGAGDPTSIDQSGNDSFTWSRDSQTVTAFEGGFFRSTEAGAGASSIFQIALVGDTVGLIDGTDSNPSVAAAATATSLTPIPEPQEYAIAALLAMGIFVTYRRRSAQALSSVA